MRYKPLHTLIILLTLILGFSFNGFSQTSYLPHYTTKNGLASNNCYYLLQDRKGYIWVCTDAGVSRFDGTAFETFTVDDGLPDNQVLQVREDSKGRIWFLSLNGQLSYFYNGKIYNPSNDKGLKKLNFNAVIVSFFEDKSGKIWFGTNKNIIGIWDGETLMKHTSPTQKNQYANAYIHQDKQGNIWAYCTDAVFIFIRNNFVLVNEKMTPLSYKTFHTANNGSIYYLDKNGLNLKKGTEDQLLIKVNEKLLNNSPGYIYADENELWLTNNNGVYIIDYKGKINHLLNNIDVNQVVKDSDNNMWFTTKNGIYRLPELKERLFIFTKENGLTSDFVKSITKDKNNRFWLGLNNSNINILSTNKKTVQKLSFNDTEKYNVIKQLCFDRKDGLVYFASDYGLGSISSSYPADQKVNYLKESNNSVFVIKNFSLDTTSKLALALSSGVVVLEERIKKFEFSSLHYNERKDYFKDRAYRVFYDDNQHLWFANINGLTQFDNRKEYKYFEKNTLLNKRINDIKQLKNNVYAMATDGYGIAFLKNGQLIKQLTKADGLNSNIINKLYFKDDFLWSVSNAGVNRIRYANNHFSVNAFDYANDLLNEDVNDIYVDKDTAYFATNNGLVYFAYNQIIREKKPPKIYITSVSINREPLDLGAASFVLKPKQQSITFNYSAIDFKNRQILYRYRLKDDANWSETRNRRLELSSLEPGNYCFEISAKSQDSDWSQPAKIKFIIEKHFWQKWWFILIALASGAYLLYIMTVKITKRQKNKEQEQLLLKNKILMLEQQALQAMMNPHFVFNVMNSIQHYINTQNTSSANRVLTGFAKLIRKNLEICTKSYISLEEELAYLKLYLTLEKNRFGDKFNYTIDVDPKLDKDETQLPSMLLQPYIENAIWHGIMPIEDGGDLKISIEQKDETYLWIKIIDNGIGIKNSLANKNGSHQSKGMGLTQERINLLNKIEAKPIQLFIEQNGDSGTTITILVPLN